MCLGESHNMASCKICQRFTLKVYSNRPFQLKARISIKPSKSVLSLVSPFGSHSKALFQPSIWCSVCPAADKPHSQLNWSPSMILSSAMPRSPSHIVQFTGTTLDSSKAKAFYHKTGQRASRHLCHTFKERGGTPITIQHLLRFLASITAVIPLARLHMRKLQNWFVRKFDPKRRAPGCCSLS